jgi:uncharacterized phage protein gp47/JayE
MAETKDTILERMLLKISDKYDKTDGSFFYDALAPAAIELATEQELADQILLYGFAQTTSGVYLDYRAAEHGVTRNAATCSSGQITITGSEGTVIGEGSLFSTAAGVQFESTSEVTIDSEGEITAAIEAVTAGTEGNVPASAICQMPVSIAGVTSVSNASATTGGTDEETDEALLTRLLEKVQLPNTSGNSSHYLLWAKEVDGIGGAKVFPLWDGAGTVKVVVIDSNKQAVDTDVVQDVTDYIEEMRPIGASVTVESATELSLDVTATVTLTTNGVLADVQTAFETSLESYLQEIAFEQDYVSYAQVGSLLLNTTGVLDYSDLTLDSGTANVTIDDTEVAVIGTVSLSE